MLFWVLPERCWFFKIIPPPILPSCINGYLPIEDTDFKGIGREERRWALPWQCWLRKSEVSYTQHSPTGHVNPWTCGLGHWLENKFTKYLSPKIMRGTKREVGGGNIIAVTKISVLFLTLTDQLTTMILTHHFNTLYKQFISYLKNKAFMPTLGSILTMKGIRVDKVIPKLWI